MSGDTPGSSVPRRRRALSNIGGQAEQAGDRELAGLLADAFEGADDPDASREHVHGFHSYPARLHPDLARPLIGALSPAGGVVLDPFCGSGTVLVESRLQGRRAIGVDLNPLAVRLARLRSRGRTAPERDALLARAREVAEGADERRQRKAGTSRRYGRDDVALFAPHVLLELDGLRVGIEATTNPTLRSDLELVLSSILTKVSLRTGDSANHIGPKRVAPGFPARHFVARTDELTRQLAEYETLLPDGAPLPDVIEADARSLPPVGPVDLVLSSPPYPGNYDYLHHHEARLRWLNLDASGIDRGEVGARRHLEASGALDARARWLGELTAVLTSIRSRLAPSGRVVLVLADSVVARQPFYNDDLLAEAAPRAGLTVVARASQARPHFHTPSAHAFDRRPRREHVICLAALPGAPPPRPDRGPAHDRGPARGHDRERQALPREALPRQALPHPAAPRQALPRPADSRPADPRADRSPRSPTRPGRRDR